MSWYEENAPDAEYVRKDQLTIWEKKIGPAKMCKSRRDLIKHILKIHIPDSLNNFGSPSYCYRTFGLLMSKKADIENHIWRKLHARQRAINKLSKNFTPYIVHYLYKPDGGRYKEIMKKTLIGRDK
jgi:hypothetical protein